MTDPTTRAAWRAEAESESRPAPEYRAVDIWQRRVIALCDELVEMEAQWTQMHEWNRVAKDALVIAQAEVERLKTAIANQSQCYCNCGGCAHREEAMALHEDAALLDVLISLADNRQDLVLSHDLVSHDPDVLEWSVELTDGRYFSADNPRDAIRAALAQRGQRPEGE